MMVLIFGCGWLGSLIVIELVKFGVRKVMFIDLDEFKIENFDVMSLVVEDDVGKFKVFVVVNGFWWINFECVISVIFCFVNYFCVIEFVWVVDLIVMVVD